MGYGHATTQSIKCPFPWYFYDKVVIDKKAY